MAQTPQQNTTASIGSAVSSFLAALKAGPKNASTQDNLFSNLLGETKDSLSQIVPREPDVRCNAQSKAEPPDNKSLASQGETRKNMARSQQTDRRENASLAASEKPERKADKKCDGVPEKDKKDTPAADASAHSDVKAAEQDTKEVETCNGGSTEDVVEKEETVDDVEAAVLLASIVPLEDCQDKMCETQAEANADQETPTTDITGVDKKNEGAISQQTPLDAMVPVAQLSAEGRGKEGKDKKASAPLNDSQKAAEGADSWSSDAAKASNEIMQPLEMADDDRAPKQGDESLYSKMIADGSSEARSSGEKATQITKPNAGSLLDNLQEEKQAAPTPKVTPALIQGIAQQAEVSRSASMPAGSEPVSSNQAMLTGGPRPAGSYDFASQLSAARVMKGGVAGLPHAVEQVSVQLHKAVKEGLDSLTIQLKPAELGKIEIKLDFGVDKTVTGTVVADNQATLNMLQKDSASLQRALQEAGLQADPGCLEFSLRDDHGASQFAHQGAGQSLNGGRFANDNAGDAEGETATTSGETETYYVAPGRVNIRV